jgi:WD40 repeat protein
MFARIHFVSLVAVFLLAASLVLLPSVPAQDVDERAEARLKALTERAAAPAGDKEKLRLDLLAFERAYTGTPYAVKAATLVTKLPSAADKLDPGKIPAVEKFAWQPKELVAVLGEHRGRHGQAVTCVAFSPDGKRIASGGYYWLRFWDPATMRLTAYFSHGYLVTSIAFSRDSKLFAAGNSAGALSVWEVLPGEQLPRQKFTVQVSSAPLHSVTFAPNGKTVACGCGDNATRLYEVSGMEAKEQAVILGHDKPVMAVAYSPDGKTLATGSADQTVRLWNATIDVPTEKGVLKGAAAEVRSLTFNPAGTTLAAGCTDGKIYLFPYPGSKPRVHFEAKNSGSVNGLSFSSTGNTLAAANQDGAVRLWNVALGQPKERPGGRLEGHVSPCSGVAYSPDNKLLVSGGQDWMVRTWDTTAQPRPKERFVPTSHLGYTYSAAFTPDTAGLVSGSIDTTARVWDLDRPEPRTRHLFKSGEREGQVHKVAVSPDGKALAFGGTFKSIRQYDPQSGRALRPCFSDHAACNALTYTPNGTFLLTSSTNQKEALLFDAATGSEVRRFGMHEVGINCLAVSPDGKQVATGSGTYLYDKMGKIVLDKENRYVYNDCTIKLWELDNGKELSALKSHKVPVYSLAYTADGRRLLSGAYEPNLRRREATDPVNTESNAFPGEVSGGYAYGLVVAPDNRHLVTLGIDHRIIFWDLESGKRLWQWASSEQLASIALASDGRHLAVTLQTGVAYVIRLNPQEK